MTGIAIITEARIGTKDRARVDVCPVQCIYEFDPVNNVLVSEAEVGSGVIKGSHLPNADAVAILGDSLLYVNVDECTSCTACDQPDVCPVGAIRSEERGARRLAELVVQLHRHERGPRPHVLVQLTRDVR